jgi:ribosomal-protein-alanine N-acetyltransferase
MQVPTVETGRLVLRGFVAEDLDPLAQILSDPEVMRYMPGGAPMARERAERTFQSILHHWEERGFGWWAVVYRSDGCLIGWCGLGHVDELDEVEVAYLLDRPYWGQGVATEGARASLKYGFEQLQLERVIALAHVENIASQRVMQKNGMTYEAHLHLWGLDLVKYAVSRAGFRPEGDQKPNGGRGR